MIRTQPPCSVGSGRECTNFGSGIVGLGHFSVRDFTFKAPSKGNAEVSFHGSLLCADTTAASKVVDLVTQITNSADAAAQPDGLRQATVLAPNTSQTLNLASTRVVAFKAAGSQTFHLDVRPLRIDAGADCSLYNAAFTVVFVP